MKKALFLFTITGLVSFTERYQQTPFQQLCTLAGGTWVMQTKKGTLCEEWKRAHNTLLTNRAYKTEGKDTTMMEQVQLGERYTEVYYTSTVPDQNEGKSVEFKLTDSKDNRFVFSNPDHDFPQRIVYHFISKDSLHAWIDGKYNGKDVKRDFYYRRVR
ncbi:MAG: DUF6265 family protein [Bacteroidota bacterium]